MTRRYSSACLGGTGQAGRARCEQRLGLEVEEDRYRRLEAGIERRPTGRRGADPVELDQPVGEPCRSKQVKRCLETRSCGPSPDGVVADNLGGLQMDDRLEEGVHRSRIDDRVGLGDESGAVAVGEPRASTQAIGALRLSDTSRSGPSAPMAERYGLAVSRTVHVEEGRKPGKRSAISFLPQVLGRCHRYPKCEDSGAVLCCRVEGCRATHLLVGCLFVPP